jgi:hypothetical protein
LLAQEAPQTHPDSRRFIAVKKSWGSHVPTVFVRQGHYARDPKILADFPAADISLDRIGDLLDHDCGNFTPRAAKVACLLRRDILI